MARINQDIKMSKRTINQKLIESDDDNLSQTPLPPTALQRPDEYSYKIRNQEPQIRLSNFSLAIVAPLLLVLHTHIAAFFGIPILQYVFVTTLTAFLVNYMGIVRKYELYPYLPETPLDNRLKISCFVTFVAMILSLYLGWNGSGGMLFAMFWEVTRGLRMNIYGVYFMGIIVGSLLMEQNYTWSKLWQFLPGLCLGWVSAQIFKLRQSNVYTIAHEMLFIASIGLPIFFPATEMIVPSIWQWLVMVVCGGLMLLTMVTVVKMMQMVRVSVAVGMTAGILMAGTSRYAQTRAYVGVGIIAVGMIMLLKMEFIDSM